MVEDMAVDTTVAVVDITGVVMDTTEEEEASDEEAFEAAGVDGDGDQDGWQTTGATEIL